MAKTKTTEKLPLPEQQRQRKRTPLLVALVATALIAVFLIATARLGCLTTPFALMRHQWSIMPTMASLLTVDAFLAAAELDLTAAQTAANAAGWRYATDLTPANLKRSSAAAVAADALGRSFAERARDLDLTNASPSQRRQIQLIIDNYGASLADPADAAEFADVVGKMQAIYGSAKWDGKPLDPTLTDVLANSRDYQELSDAFIGWRNATGPEMRPLFKRYMELANKAARDGGFADMADQWLSGYEIPAREMQDIVEDLWDGILPHYMELHCYVRRKLAKRYGKQHFGKDKLIPAHLLGNMWAQQWSNIGDLVMPFPDAPPPPDITRALRDQGYTAQRMHSLAESFYVGIGFGPLPTTFWDRSMLTKPADRDVVCHASAWDIDGDQDVRIKMCTEPTADHLQTVHHEQGHLYYDLAYAHQPVAFRGGAADFFHEAIGDAIALSVMTPGHLREIGLAPPDDAKASKRGSDGEEEMNAADKTAINTLMRVALSKLAFMPFAYAVDKWRWAAAREDQVTPENYTASWWTTVAAFQGLKPPVERGAAADAAGMLDAGAKYHVAAHVPYLRYFGAHVLEFQLHRAACRASGWPSHRPLHECSISQSKAAGDRIAAMLGLGASVPWPEAIGVATGGQEHELDATAMVQYLQPLLDWLRKENLRHEGGDEDETCAWDGMTDGSHLRRRRRR